MSETQFSKADWRPSKKRATCGRQRAWGGQKRAPLVFLAAAKLAGLNTNRAMRCSRIAVSTGRPCRRVAMKGTTLCLSHGREATAQRHMQTPIPRPGMAPAPPRAGHSVSGPLGVEQPETAKRNARSERRDQGEHDL
jgi:hypothetical protein